MKQLLQQEIPKKYLRVIVGATVSLLMIFIVGFFAYNRWEAQQIPSSWKTYTNDEFGISFKYPERLQPKNNVNLVTDTAATYATFYDNTTSNFAVELTSIDPTPSSTELPSNEYYALFDKRSAKNVCSVEGIVAKNKNTTHLYFERDGLEYRFIFSSPAYRKGLGVLASEINKIINTVECYEKQSRLLSTAAWKTFNAGAISFALPQNSKPTIAETENGTKYTVNTAYGAAEIEMYTNNQIPKFETSDRSSLSSFSIECKDYDGFVATGFQEEYQGALRSITTQAAVFELKTNILDRQLHDTILNTIQCNIKQGGA